MFNGLLTLTVFLPALAGIAIVVIFRGKATENKIRWSSIGIATITFVLTLVVFFGYDTERGGIQFVDYYQKWIPIESLKSSYILGVDGLSAPLVLLTGLLGMVAAFASWRINVRVKEYFLWLLFLETSVLGVFTSLDLILFFVFFEFELIPMYMLISIWGNGRPQYSAMKFVLFTAMGGVFLLIGILCIYMSTSVTTMTMVAIPSIGIQQGIPEMLAGSTLIAPAALIFIFFLVAFAVKLPVWPLHSWLPDAHTDAPTAVSIMLAGVLLKMAGYGILRINIGFFQQTSSFNVSDAAPYIAGIAAFSTVIGAVVTIRQTDMKRLIAYSSVSHMGYVLLGVSAISHVDQKVAIAGLSGAALQMFTHGTITGLAFLTIGLTYDRTHTRYIPHLGGLWKKLPFISVFFLIAGLASLGLPGTSGFVSEIMVFVGTFKVWPVPTMIAAFGVVLAAGYVLWMIQRTLFGEGPSTGGLSKTVYKNLTDVGWKEMIPMVLLGFPILLVGVWPRLITDMLEKGIGSIIR